MELKGEYLFNISFILPRLMGLRPPSKRSEHTVHYDDINELRVELG